MKTNIVQQYVPAGVLEDDFSTDKLLLPHVDDLEGKKLTLYFNNGWTIEHCFLAERRLDWLVTAGQGVDDASSERYIATNPRLGIYFVDFVRTKERAVSVSLVLDTIHNIFTAVIGELPTRQELNLSCLDRIVKSQDMTSVKTTFLHGSIGTPLTSGTLLKPETPLHEETAELVGKRVIYTYNDHEQYEHIYVNQNFYAWHCLLGREHGLSDVDRCHYFKVGHKFYLFVWRDKIIPAMGVELIDLRSLKTTGKIFGYQGNDFGRLSNFQVSATVRTVCDL
jgi:phenolic acid decarboxylase